MTKDLDEAFVITLDGPAATGKSTVARQVADRLNIPYVSSGLLYRAATHLVLEHGTNAVLEDDVVALLEQHSVNLEPIPLVPNKVWIDGRESNKFLHTDSVDEMVSAVSAHPKVRRWVYAQLRKAQRPFVIEGRDMGTVVFPEARLKFYLSASARVRAERRVSERDADLSVIEAAIKRRDQLDAKQLEPAPDAVHIDTSDLSLEQVVDAVLSKAFAHS